MPIRRFLLLLSCFALLPVVSGCSKDEQVTRYKVPRPEPQRLLGAIIAQGEHTWYFKLAGPQTAIGKHEEEFLRFIQSIRFADKADRPAWEAPKGWQEKPGSELRFATFKLGAEASPLELTVFRFGADSGSLLSNVNRWRGQLGLPNTDEDGLKKLTRTVKAGDLDVTLVDMKAEQAVPADEKPAATSRLPSYKLPEGWKKSTREVEFSLATFEAGDPPVQVTLSRFRGQAGGMLLNINRWRDQVGQDRVGEAEMKKELKPLEVDGVSADYADLSSPASAAKKQRILGVVVVRDGFTWFIKLTGPLEPVEKHKYDFEAFLKSIRFDGGSGAKP